MKRPEIKKLYTKAWNLHGENFQLGMLMEECAELIQATNKYIRYRDTPPISSGTNLAEEIADVEVMIDQIKETMNYLCIKEKVEKIKSEKLERLKRRLS